jgi:TPR repeat protein
VLGLPGLAALFQIDPKIQRCEQSEDACRTGLPCSAEPVCSIQRQEAVSLNKHKLFILGSLYSLGLGCDKDNREAFKCFQLSSLDGCPPSISSLGNCYALGIGVSKDPEAGFRLFQRAADLGDPVARYNLAVCYKEGIGTSPNYWKALECYYLAARQGYVHPSHSFFDTFCLMLFVTSAVLLLVICLIMIILLIQ